VRERVPIDLYVGEHARLKRRMEAALDSVQKVASGASDDPGDLERAIATLCDDVRRHIDGENRVLHPLIDEVFSDARESLDHQHVLEGQLVRHLEAALGDLRARWAPEGARPFQRLLERFVAALHTHMAEEEALMPVLRELVPLEELQAAAEELARFSDSRRG
jgi:hemerythrin-like domain-containing protein